MRGETIRVVVVSRKEVTRAGYRFLLDAQPDLIVVDDAPDIAEVMGGPQASQPDVVVFDTGDGLDVSSSRRALNRSASAARILALVDQRRPLPHDTLGDGVRGVLLSQSTPEQIAAAVRLIAADYTLSSLPQGVEQAQAGSVVCRPEGEDGPAEADLAHLTRREADVLRLLARGLSNAEISAALFVSESTVKSHVQHLLTKLELRNRVHAVIYAYEIGLMRAQPQRLAAAAS